MSVSSLLDQAIQALAEARTVARGEQSLSFDAAAKLNRAIDLVDDVLQDLEKAGAYDIAIADMVIAACREPQ
jgi:hypothetical protein